MGDRESRSSDCVFRFEDRPSFIPPPPGRDLSRLGNQGVDQRRHRFPVRHDKADGTSDIRLEDHRCCGKAYEGMAGDVAPAISND